MFFIGSGVRLADQGGDLDFHAKSMACEIQRMDDFSAKGFVASLDIRHVAIGQEIA
jgi:hypothetical protein